MSARRATFVVAVLALVSVAVVGCTGEGDEAAADPAALLADAKTTLDGTSSVHFVLSSADVPDGVTALVGGEGDAARPDGFVGDLDVTIGGVAATVAVVSTGGTLYAQLPFSTGFTETDPSTIGISDPGTLLAADGGVTGLLAAATDPGLLDDIRIGETVVRQVEATLPASAVADVLASADDAGTFTAVFGIDPETSQLLRATITGPFLAVDTPSTYTVDLSDYDVPVEITAPTG